MTNKGWMLAGALAGLVGAGCGGEGTLKLSLYGEDFAESGIPAEEVSDGWALTFDEVKVTVRDAEARRDGDDDAQVTFAGPRELNVAEDSGGEGQELASATVPSGAYGDVTWRVDGFHIKGAAVRGGETKTFEWSFDTDTRYLACESSAEVPSGGEATAQLTIHVDHLFFDGLFDDEPNVAFDLIAQADTMGNADGAITRDELEATDLRTQARYGVGSTGITDLWSFIRYQVTQVGHIDGEGHCETERLR